MNIILYNTYIIQYNITPYTKGRQEDKSQSKCVSRSVMFDSLQPH